MATPPNDTGAVGSIAGSTVSAVASAAAATGAAAAAAAASDLSLKYPESLLTVLRGFRNGVVYGCKIRFPHALVMTLLFRDGTWYEKGKAILEATYTHARNLGFYAAAFKLFRELLRHFRNHEDHWNTTIAGFIAGGLMFGTNDPVSSQINMYVMSRVIFGWGRTALNKKLVRYTPFTFTLFASVTWAMVMYLFFFQKGTLQSSLISSMKYLYCDSDTWPTDATNPIDWLMR